MENRVRFVFERALRNQEQNRIHSGTISSTHPHHHQTPLTLPVLPLSTLYCDPFLQLSHVPCCQTLLPLPLAWTFTNSVLSPLKPPHSPAWAFPNRSIFLPSSTFSPYCPSSRRPTCSFDPKLGTSSTSTPPNSKRPLLLFGPRTRGSLVLRLRLPAILDVLEGQKTSQVVVKEGDQFLDLNDPLGLEKLKREGLKKRWRWTPVCIYRLLALLTLIFLFLC